MQDPRGRCRGFITGQHLPGATNVNNGTLLINGSTSTSSAVTVASAGILGGTGTVGGAVTINSGGTLAPGASVASFATGTLTRVGGSTFAYEIDSGADLGVAGDLLAVSGNLTLDLANTSILTLADPGAGTWDIGDKLTLISYSGAWNGCLFSYGSAALENESKFTSPGWTGSSSMTRTAPERISLTTWSAQVA